MITLLVALHLVFMAVSLGGRVIFIPMIHEVTRQELNERLDGVPELLLITKYSDFALIGSFLSGVSLFFLTGVSLIDSAWSMKLKMVTFCLVFIAIGAFHIAKARIVHHFDRQMIPAVKRSNLIAVLLLSVMVLFASF